MAELPQELPVLGILPRAGLLLQAGTSLEHSSSPATLGYGGCSEHFPSVGSSEFLLKRPSKSAGSMRGSGLESNQGKASRVSIAPGRGLREQGEV